MISNEAFIECVPNFSEGCNTGTINAIAEAIRSVDGVRVLHIDRGEAANRTVITFVGQALSVAEAAFRMVKRASELIDMRTHLGEHPRIGATDVLPLIPLKNITLAECAELARALAERIYKELGIPTYCYEASYPSSPRTHLGGNRQGLRVRAGRPMPHSNRLGCLTPYICAQPRHAPARHTQPA